MQEQGCDFRLKTKNSDFRVTEVPLLPSFDSKPKLFSYLWLEKSNYTTFGALEKLQEFFGLDFGDTVAEGLKDEDGITGQLISIRKRLSKKDIKDFNDKNCGEDTFIKIGLRGCGSEPLCAKALHGNAFQIIVRNLTETEAEKIAFFVRKDRFFSFVNYYDNQRFGLPGGPYTTHLIGKAICEENWGLAYDLLKESGNEIPENKTGKDAFLALNPSRVGFYISAYSSFLWNEAVSEHLGKIKGSKKNYFPGVGDLYLPSTTAGVVAETFVVDGFRFDKEKFVAEKYKNGRNIVLPTAVYVDKIEDDEIFDGKKCLMLSFFLHTGCYATMMVKQIIKKSLEEKND